MSKLKASTIINAVNTGIALNPSHVVLDITRKEIVEGAFEDVHEQIETDIVFYFPYNQQQSKVYLDVQGQSTEANKYKGYASNQIDLKIDNNTKCYFKDVLGNKYCIEYVYPILVEETLCGYELEITKED